MTKKGKDHAPSYSLYGKPKGQSIFLTPAPGKYNFKTHVRFHARLYVSVHVEIVALMFPSFVIRIRLCVKL